MKKEIKVNVEKITDGYLFTETLEDNKKKKSFKESKGYIFELLNKSEGVDAFLENEEDITVEIIVYNSDFEEPNINDARDRVVIKDKYDPLKGKIDEKELRLSVTTKNAYSVERLKSIDFVALNDQLPMTAVRRADISGMHRATFNANWNNIKKGTALFGSPQSRIAFTVLAKFYEMTLDIRSSKKDELDRIKEGIEKEIENLNVLYQKKNHIHSNSVEPIIFALKQLIKIDG